MYRRLTLRDRRCRRSRLRSRSCRRAVARRTSRRRRTARATCQLTPAPTSAAASAPPTAGLGAGRASDQRTGRSYREGRALVRIALADRAEVRHGARAWLRASSTRIRSFSSSTATRRSKHRRRRIGWTLDGTDPRIAALKVGDIVFATSRLRGSHSQADAHGRRRAGDSRTSADHRHHQEGQLRVRRAARSELAHRRRKSRISPARSDRPSSTR